MKKNTGMLVIAVMLSVPCMGKEKENNKCHTIPGSYVESLNLFLEYASLLLTRQGSFEPSDTELGFSEAPN